MGSPSYLEGVGHRKIGFPTGSTPCTVSSSYWHAQKLPFERERRLKPVMFGYNLDRLGAVGWFGKPPPYFQGARCRNKCFRKGRGHVGYLFFFCGCDGEKVKD